MAIPLVVVAPGLGPQAAAAPRGPHGATSRPACGPAGSAGPPPPNDPYWSSQWNLCRIRAPAAWTVSTGRGVRIGIVDTGVDRTQPDLSAKVVATADCLGAHGDPGRCRTGPGAARDDNGHGTAVAGLAAATTNNDLGVAGTAPGAALVVAKALTSRGSGTFGDVNAGIEWAVNHGAQVVNLSLGAGGPVVAGPAAASTSLLPGIDYAWSHGVVPVLAAGNTDALGQATTQGDGNVPALVVGATGPEDRPAPYSSPTGDAPWALVAPGGSAGLGGRPTCSMAATQADCILSTWSRTSPSGASYAYDEGTSMAAPEVSGTVALLLAMGRSPRQAVEAVLSGADRGVGCGADAPTCAGLLDAAAAVGLPPGASGRSGTTAATAAPATPPPPSRAAAEPSGAHAPRMGELVRTVTRATGAAAAVALVAVFLLARRRGRRRSTGV